MPPGRQPELEGELAASDTPGTGEKHVEQDIWCRIPGPLAQFTGLIGRCRPIPY
jgi:hypothetical protein